LLSNAIRGFETTSCDMGLIGMEALKNEKMYRQ